MSKLSIINVPDPLLKTVSTPVAKVDSDVRQLLDDMLETMYAAPGIGLAAIQVAVAKRMIVVDTSAEEDENSPLFLVNPEVVWESEEHSVYSEGCLSVPEHYADIERPMSVRVKYLDYNNEMQETLMDGLTATCVQHEIDHLDGIVFIDYLSKLKRNMIVKKVQKAQKDSVIL